MITKEKNMLILGGGISALSSALRYKKMYPEKQIRVLEKGKWGGYLQTCYFPI
jgi:protoporphyrinogen oxidase